MKKKLALCITAVLLVCLCAGGVTAMAAESELGASAACEGHTLGTFNGVPACVNENGDLHVCENNFPDEGFRDSENCIMFILDETGNRQTVQIGEYITEELSEQIIQIYLHETSLLKGIEFFKHLQLIDAKGGFTDVDISKNSELTNLSLSSDKFTTLKASDDNCNTLTYLSIQSSALTEFDASNYVRLTDLHVYAPLLVNIDVSGNTELDFLGITDTQLKELDLSNNRKLYQVQIYDNKLEKLLLSDNDSIVLLWCQNNLLTSLDVPATAVVFKYENNKLAELDLSEVERIDPDPDSVGNPSGFSYSPQNITVESSISGGKYVVDLSSVISPENLGKVANLSAGTYDSNTGIVTFDAMPESFTYYYDVGGEFDPMEVVVTVTNPKYEITQGADSTWTESAGDGLTITANGDFDSFTGVKVNGELLDRDNYTAVSGSTVITLKPEYLATLETGTYKLTVVYTDGEANTTFAVSAKEQPGTTDPENPGAAETEKPGTEKPANPDDVPQTGDSGMIIALTAIFVLTISGFAAVTVYRKKHN